MGEIVDKYYSQAWAATSATHQGAEEAKRQIEPRLKALEERVARLEAGLMELLVQIHKP